MVINNKFNLGDTIILSHDISETEYIITGILVRTGGFITYNISHSCVAEWVYEVEILKTIKSFNSDETQQNDDIL